ncbi:MAG: acyl-homoserine-lactone acylase [Rhodospirillaceae bacterium]|nr:acyl-homoserine-lactone acylase [Rhodospirillaceae bacterium]
MTAAVIGFFWLRGSLPMINGTLTVAGPAQRIDILRDDNGIPHIYAASAADAYFGLGFVHAQDRLWQMETGRRAGAGRLSEVFGTRTVGIDRYLRTLGLMRRAETVESALDPDARALLRAYVAGVNARIRQAASPPAPEFVLFRYRPEDWRPADSAVLVSMMALQLDGNARDELLRNTLTERLGEEKTAALWGEPPPPPQHGAVLPATASDALAAIIPPAPRGLGSNNWVVSGERAANGRPMLANDPHLTLATPGPWYLVHLEAPGLSVAGATLPGVPAVIVGRNDRIAWGVTNTGSDVQDLFAERVVPGTPSSYLTPDGVEAFAEREETITVKDSDPVTQRVRESRHGPIVSDASPLYAADEGEVVALSWSALGEGLRTLQAGFRLAAARDWSDFTHALRDYEGPQQNFVYGDLDGHIGFYAPGRIPIRSSGDGKRPNRGWTGEGDWTGFIPFDDLPHAFDPDEGRIATANARITGPDYPYFLTDDWAESYRVDRIVALLDAQQTLSPDDFSAIQNDALSLFAEEFAPYLEEAEPKSEPARAAIALIRGWDQQMRRDRPEPLIFSAWYRALTRLVYADELGDAFPNAWGFRTKFMRRVLDGEEARWCDDIGTDATESCGTMAEMALEEAIAALTTVFGDEPATWKWGDAHPAVAPNQTLGQIPILSRLVNLAAPLDGGPFTVAQARYRMADSPAAFPDIHGVSLRLLFDLASPDSTRAILPTGQSGNPFSSWYDDMFPKWRDGTTVPLPMTRSAVEAATASRLELEPAAEP